MPHDEKPSSIWKKELSFKRKPATENRASETAGPAEDVGPPASVWKKEISLRRKPKEAAAAPELEQSAETLAPTGPELPEPPPPEPVVELPRPPAPEPLLPAAIDHSWLTQPLEEEVALPLEPALPAEPELPAVLQLLEPREQTLAVVPDLVPEPTVLPEPVLLEPAPALEALPEQHAPDPAPVLEPDPVFDLTMELPAFPPELLEAAAGLLPPVTPAAPAGEPVQQKLPLHRRNVSLGRGKKAAQAETSTPKVPLHKRQLNFGRRAKAEQAVVAEPPPVSEEAGWDESDVKVPFYKRELSLKRNTRAKPVSVEETPKAEQAARPPKEPREWPSLQRMRRPRPVGKGAKKLVGLKIGASQIAAARIVNGEEPELLQLVREPLDAGIVVGGELRDPEALALALREFFRKHGLPRRGVRLGIANNRIGVRTFDVNGIDDPKQLANAIRFRAQEVLPIPIEEAVLDYQILSESVDGEGSVSRRVLLVVAYRELVDRYVYACGKAGIQIVGIDLEAFALLRALAPPHTPVPGSERGVLVAVSVGHDRSTFAVSDGRVCEFTRVLEWGGWALNVAIARALDLSPTEAEPIKRSLSFVGADVLPEGIDEGQLAAARDAARRQLQSFARELVSSLQFYQNQPGSLSIGEIVLTGGTTHMPGFAAELERLIGVPVRVGDPMARLKVSKKLRESEQSGSLAIAIGLGIED